MKECKKCNNTRVIKKFVVFVDRRGRQHECERSAPCPCLQSASKPKDSHELMVVGSGWDDGNTQDKEVTVISKRLENGAIRRRAA